MTQNFRLRLALPFLLPLVATAGAAAADLPPQFEPTPLRPALVEESWSGAHVGVAVGAALTETRGTLGINSTTLDTLPPVSPVTSAAGSNPINGAGPIVGVSAGYDMDLRNGLVLGAEADFAWTGAKGATQVIGATPVVGAPFGFYQQGGLDWLATVRGRVGFSPVQRALLYATGGLAIGGERFDSNYGNTFNEYEFFRSRSARLGWTLGAGVELALSHNWSAKAEYLHADFGPHYGVGAAPLNDGTVAWVGHRMRTSVDLVRLGLNYRFGAGAFAP
ncbi:MAG: porin family protein [Hyphomicrobiales bacterium]|nr:porin family protein [Hyphomicrobiales bacterium]